MTQPNTLTRSIRTALSAGAVGLGALGLAACGGGGGSSSGDGSLTVGVTDAPIDSAQNVFVEFSCVGLKLADDDDGTNGDGNGGDDLAGSPDQCGGGGPADTVIELDPPKQIDLLAQQGSSAPLVEDEQIEAGDYAWVRLGVNLDGDKDTYIVLDDGSEHELDVPSGDETGLKLVSAFTLDDGGSLDLTIDFDLRKSIVKTGEGDFKLKPALRLVQNAEEEAGQIDVTVTEGYLTDANRCDTDTTDQAAYIYEGSGVSPDDEDGNDPDPVTTVSLEMDSGTGDFVGTSAPLEPGTYTAAFTCEPDNDDPEADDTLTFHDAEDVEVNAGETATYDLDADDL